MNQVSRTGLGIVAVFLAATAHAQEQAAREFRECSDCPTMVGIPAGKFLMGSSPRESGRFDTEGPQHTVSIRAFALSKYPVSSAEFLAFLRETQYQPAPCNPILNLTWRVTGGHLAYPPL